LLCLISWAVAEQSKWQFPDSPTGRALSAFLDVIEQGGNERIKDFIDSFLDPDFRDAISLSQHQEQLQNVHEVLGEVALINLEKPNQHTVKAILKSVASGEMVAISIELNERPPHGIVGLSMRPHTEEPPPPPIISEHYDTNAVVVGDLGMRLHQFMQKQEQNGFSGAVLAVENGKNTLHRGYGWANREKRIPNTTSTVFDVASYAKEFTQAAILQLEGRGRLSTDDRITRFFEDVPEDKQKITVHHLLTMGSGLHEYHDSSGDFESMDRQEAVAQIMAQKLRFEPGSDRGYSNSGYTLLAVIIEKVSGEPYQEYCHRHLFEPAAMLHTGFYQDPRWREEQVAHGYDARRFGEQNSPYHWPEITWACIGNGCVVSSPGDLGRWLRALRSGRILSEDGLDKLYTIYKKPVETDWGGPVLAFAEANDFGFTAASYEFPATASYIFVCANSAIIEAPVVAQQLARLLFE
jgi:CubicO group peptidase (beta-lactamase class C family)